jgi:hypothetical protein
MISSEDTHEDRLRSSGTPIMRLLAATMSYRAVGQGPSAAAEARSEPFSKVLDVIGQHRNGSHPDTAKSFPQLAILKFAITFLSVGKCGCRLNHCMSQIVIV